MQLKDKTILIISPQAWGLMFISKHHFAIELAKRGNRVYFLNPPGEGDPATKGFAVSPLPQSENLLLIDHRLRFPARLRFHLPGVFDWFMKKHIRRLLNFLPVKPDIIWSFDLNKVYPFASFPADTYKLFHPVDEPLTPQAIASGNGAQIIFSVTEEIISKYAHLPVPRYSLNHGVTDIFIQEGAAQMGQRTPGPVRVGISGNMLRADLDREMLLKIVAAHPDKQFECWGACKLNSSNIGGGADAETAAFINALEAAPNVILHGPVPSTELAKALPRMDLFLICYDVIKDQSKGTNYHKILEYLASGKVIVSNNVTTYKDRPDLVQMIADRNSNNGLEELFREVVTHLDQYNSPQAMKVRCDFARSNTYASKVDRIESLL